MDQDYSTPTDPQSPTGPETALAPRLDDASGAREDSEEELRRPWRAEMARWLLTLNPGRTQDEYAKAVRYFFETPGVPQDLDAISPDLLLAYRGALTMRAERGRKSRSASNPAGDGAARLARLWGRASRVDTLAGDSEPNTPPTSNRATPLAPATVNLRLTALRQFLRYAALRQSLADLTPDRVHMSLRRLPIERRRPYQILSEEEWPDFLATARLPLQSAPLTSVHPAQGEPASLAASPWGHTRAERQRTAQTADYASDSVLTPEAKPLRASDGRTGALTAQRDFALVALALATGLRAIELSLLDISDLTRERRRGHDEWWLALPDEKTKGQRGGRTLPLASELVATLLDYIRATGRELSTPKDRTSPLFLALARGPHPEHDSTERRRLRPEQIRGVINRVETQWMARQGEEAESPDHVAEGRRISPHALRHSAAIALLKGSDVSGRPPASVEHVRGWLGHFDIRTTQRYLDHLNTREERRKFTIAPQLPHTIPHGVADISNVERPSSGEDE